MSIETDVGTAPMKTYIILRRRGWTRPDDAQAAGARSKAAGDEMSDDLRWIRSYVLAESDGSIGTLCVYQATSEDAIREHGSRSDIPTDEIVEIVDTVVVRPDPLVGAVS